MMIYLLVIHQYVAALDIPVKEILLMAIIQAVE